MVVGEKRWESDGKGYEGEGPAECVRVVVATDAGKTTGSSSTGGCSHVGFSYC